MMEIGFYLNTIRVSGAIVSASGAQNSNNTIVQLKWRNFICLRFSMIICVFVIIEIICNVI